MGTIRKPDATDPRADKDRQHKVGDRVQWMGTGEVGVVVRTWYNEDFQEQDCYVCFDDGGHPDTEPGEEGPYILRYAAPSLYPVGWDQEPLEAWWDDKPEPWDDEPHPVESYPKPRTYRAIRVEKSECHVVEYQDIVDLLLDDYDASGELPETREEVEELITIMVQDEFGGFVRGPHEKREEVEELVQGFYTDFENREW